MTIRRNVNLAVMSSDYAAFEAGVDAAPEGSFSMSRNLKFEIGDATDDLIRMVRRLGLNVNNSDGAREIEALLFGWVRDANPDNPEFAMTQSFGCCLDEATGDAERQKVIDAHETAYHDIQIVDDEPEVRDDEDQYAGADAPFPGQEA